MQTVVTKNNHKVAPTEYGTTVNRDSQQKETKPETETVCCNKNQPKGSNPQPKGDNRTQDNPSYCRDVYTQLKKLPWQQKSFIFTQIFLPLYRSHRKLLNS